MATDTLTTTTSVFFPTGAFVATNTWATTGLLPLTIGSVDTFTLRPGLNGLPWDLTLGKATLIMTDPGGNQFSYPAQIQGSTAMFTWIVTGPPGTWLRAWDVTDANGKRQISRPIAFAVISSPS